LSNKFLRLNYNKFAVLAGDLVDIETLLTAKYFFSNLGLSNFYINKFSDELNVDFSFLFLFNVQFKAIEIYPTFCILIGTNPRLEAPVLNLKLRKAYLNNNTNFYSFGAGLSYLSYPVNNLSNSLKSVLSLCEFKHSFCKKLYNSLFSLSPLILVGINLLEKRGGCVIINAILNFVKKILSLSTTVSFFYRNFYLNLKISNFFGIVSNTAHRAGAYEIGFLGGSMRAQSKNNIKDKNLTLIYSLGAQDDFYSISDNT
jgi:NADH-quinone oxidoreductase subunit G